MRITGVEPANNQIKSLMLYQLSYTLCKKENVNLWPTIARRLKRGKWWWKGKDLKCPIVECCVFFLTSFKILPDCFNLRPVKEILPVWREDNDGNLKFLVFLLMIYFSNKERLK